VCASSGVSHYFHVCADLRRLMRFSLNTHIRDINSSPDELLQFQLIQSVHLQLVWELRICFWTRGLSSFLFTSFLFLLPFEKTLKGSCLVSIETCSWQLCLLSSLLLVLYSTVPCFYYFIYFYRQNC